MNNSSSKHCWICSLTNEHDDCSTIWLSPCRCRDTMKWVHNVCLQRWIDEQQERSNESKVLCPRCYFEYIIVFPKQSLLIDIFDKIEIALNFSSTLLTMGFFAGSAYWTMTTYGALTTMQMIGYEKGLSVMEKINPFFLSISLPAIPYLLIYTRLIRWDEILLKFWRRYSDNNSNLLHRPMESKTSLARLICGGLLLPTIATLIGKILFQDVDSKVKRTIIGGVTYIVLKGFLKIYYKQNEHTQRTHREILNYDSQSSSSETDQSSINF